MKPSVAAGQEILRTERLVLRQQTLDDAPFVLRLLNEPSWLRYIGDRGVRTLPDASRYIREGALRMYREHGLGLYRVELVTTGEPIGLCGLLRRETLDHPDLGFALLPAYWGHGYAREAAAAVLDDARERLGVKRIVAITSIDNDASGRLLQRLGFRHEGVTRLGDDAEQLRLYVLD